VTAATLRASATTLDRLALAAEDGGHLSRADALRRRARDARRLAVAAELREIGAGVAA
jgi:hypothetical protein